MTEGTYCHTIADCTIVKHIPEDFLYNPINTLLQSSGWNDRMESYISGIVAPRHGTFTRDTVEEIRQYKDSKLSDRKGRYEGNTDLCIQKVPAAAARLVILVA